MSSKHKLGALYPRPKLDAISETAIRTAAIRPAVASFVENVQRVNRLLVMPFRIVFETVLAVRAGDEMEYKHTGKLEPMTDLLDPSTQPEGWENDRAGRYHELCDLAANLSADDEGKLIDGMCPGLEWQLSATDGTPVEPWLSSAIIGAWTAIETLTGDLWEAAVNAHPHGLAKLRGDWPKGKEKGQPEGKGPLPPLVNTTPLGKVSEEKSIRLAALEDYDFNVSSVMGTLLRDSRYDFQNLKDIKRAYVQAFFENQEDVLDAILDPCLYHLSQVRHLLVHRAGIVDQKFIDSTRGVPMFAGVEIRKPLPIDGELVRDLVNPAVEKSVSLIQAVDNWLQSHSGGTP